MRRVLVGGLAAWLAAAALSAAPPFESHEARLQIRVNGQPVGTENYSIRQTGTEIEARSRTRLRAGAQEVEQEARLLLSAELHPRRYEWKMENPKEVSVRMTFSGTSGTITYPLPDGEEDKQVFEFGTARVAVLDNNIFHHFVILAQLYDFEQGGAQSIEVFVPQAVQPGKATVELLGIEQATLAGQPQPVRHLVITTPDNRVLLWVTQSGRLVRLQVPGANVEVVAEEAGP